MSATAERRHCLVVRATQFRAENRGFEFWVGLTGDWKTLSV